MNKRTTLRRFKLIRILIITRFYRNGQTTHVLELCRELIRQKQDVLLLISHLDHLLYRSWLEQAKIPYCTSLNPNRLTRHGVNWKPQLIHNHSAQTLQLASDLARVFQVPLVTTVHYLDFQPLALLEEQEACIVISSEMERKLANLKVTTYRIENGVQIPKKKLETKRWHKEALFLAQVSQVKERNFQMMAQTLLACGWKVKSAGDWRYPNVQSLGWVTDVYPLLQEANLVVGTGRAIREAMAAGCSAWVLGEFCDGLVTPQNVVHLQESNFSGRATKNIFNPNQAREILANPNLEQFDALGSFGYNYAQEHFSSTTMVNKLLQVYKKHLHLPDKNKAKQGISPKMSN